MYRQILVDSRDINYQRILWRRSPHDVIIIFLLLTVTYGQACAPFLALAVLEQLTIDEGKHFPLAIPILRKHIYIDDAVFGADDKLHIRQIRDQLVALLKRGGFELKKWASNSPSLLDDIDVADHGLAGKKSFAQDEQLKILGIGWNPSKDVFEYRVALSDKVPDTKRTILSAVAKLYDPLGWATPVTIAAKILMQRLWQLNIQWDELLSESVFARWNDIYSRLSALGHVQIPRWNGLGPDAERSEIHGFADASNHAYAAVVYIKVVSSSGKVTISLLVGKSKVAPLKTISIPRLELCAALLLARLIDFVRALNGYQNLPYYCWTDSNIVLAWIAQDPSRWKTFVANRVTQIQALVPRASWRHVSTNNNPADCASRGIFGDEILNHELWWHGPSWLTLNSDEWPIDDTRLPESAPLEEKTIVLQCHAPGQWDLATKYSSWPRLIRVTAYIIKFTRFCRRDRPSDSLNLALTASPPSKSISLSAPECN
ncbi:uncharacterized protein LOC143898862 [Temnothorax americanus]|uniref:uncharacterized protein LOC143898862 n=1 Tax=Temnothorax americanus TaxID=1964332 RepID=UPI0040684F57